MSKEQSGRENCASYETKAEGKYKKPIFVLLLQAQLI
jgi:hypothetical protein